MKWALFVLLDEIMFFPLFTGPKDVGCVYQNQTVVRCYGIHSVEVPGYHKWSRHVTIMVTWFPIWAPHRELSCKSVSVEFQVATFSNCSPVFSASSILLALVAVHCNCDYDDVLVCRHVLCCHVRCVGHVRGALS